MSDTVEQDTSAVGVPFQQTSRKGPDYRTWFRGEHTNFNPKLAQIMDVDGPTKFVLDGWLPDEPIIDKDTQITAFGSCFAANISNWLSQRNFRVLNKADDATRAYVVTMGEGGFKAEAERYHLYVSYACPWAHRTLIFRALKGLTDLITVSVVHPDMLNDGWTFASDYKGATGDTLYGLPFARDIYIKALPDVSGRVTVPILWDKKTETIVSNESSEIIRMFNSAFNEVTGNTDDYWPEEMRDDIEEVNARIYDTLNNGVYRSGFATTQQAYDEAVSALFETMDWLEDRLSKSRYLMADRLTEADWRLVPTLFRFDPVYHLHFKCNRSRLVDFPNLWAYTRELYQRPGVAETVNFDHIVRHYHYSHDSINPHRIVPINPVIDWMEPHGRDVLKAA